MQFGVQFFPDVRPRAEIAVYFGEALILAEEADRLGFCLSPLASMRVFAREVMPRFTGSA
ncbi:MAG: hypothetical protein WB678_01390 [Stellaceae bacterium]